MEKVIYVSNEKLLEMIKQKETQVVISSISSILGCIISDLVQILIDRIFKVDNILVYKQKYEKKYGIKFIAENDINEMAFPVNHPVDGVIYANSEITPNFYCPISTYHDYLQEIKYNDFIKLCSSLGAKSIKLLSEVDFDAEVSTKNKLKFFKNADCNLDVATHHKKNELYQIEYSFEKNTDHIYKYESPWFAEEPSWKQMQEMRLGSKLVKQNVKYSYIDDFGISANFAADMLKIGASLGGEFKRIKRIQKEYEIEFWPFSEEE